MARKINTGSFTADFQGPLVVFVIGMRINQLWRIDKWLPVARAMGPMIAELAANPDSGFLGCEQLSQGFRTQMLVQYWRDFDSLESYARAREQKHLPAWAAFNLKVGNHPSVGIFHETYCVETASYETIYGNMPNWGLGRIAGIVPATGRHKSARLRMKGEV